MRPVLLLAGLSLILVSSGCSARRGEPISGPLRTGSPEAAQGEKAFMAHCHKCHPGGEGGLGLAINNKPLPGVMIKAMVRTGLGAMPSFSKERLSEEQLDNVVEYLKVLRKK